MSPIISGTLKLGEAALMAEVAINQRNNCFLIPFILVTHDVSCSSRSNAISNLTSANKCDRSSLNFSIRVQLVTSYFLDSIRILFIFKTDLFTTLSGFLACSSVQEMFYCYSSIQSCQKYTRVYYVSVRAEKK